MSSGQKRKQSWRWTSLVWWPLNSEWKHVIVPCCYRWRESALFVWTRLSGEQPILSTCRGTTSMMAMFYRWRRHRPCWTSVTLWRKDHCVKTLTARHCIILRLTFYLGQGWFLGNGTVAGPGPAWRYFIWEGGASADAGATVVLPAPTRQMPNNHVFKWPLAQAEIFFYW